MSSMAGSKRLNLENHEWVISDERVGGGGFGRVVVAASPGIADDAVAKFVPKEPGADRELSSLTGAVLQTWCRSSTRERLRTSTSS